MVLHYNGNSVYITYTYCAYCAEAKISAKHLLKNISKIADHLDLSLGFLMEIEDRVEKVRKTSTCFVRFDMIHRFSFVCVYMYSFQVLSLLLDLL